MLAKRADKVGGQLLTLIDVAADLADPALLLGERGRLRLDVFKVVAVGHGRDVRQLACLGHVGNEQHMRFKLNGLDDLAGQERLRAGGDVADAIDGARGRLRVGKFVDIAPGLEAIVLEHGKRRVLRQNGDIEHTGLFDHIAGVIAFIDGDADALGCVGLLHDGVDDAAVVLFAVARGENVKPVGKREHRVLLDGLGILVDRGCGMVHAVIDCLRKNVHLRKLRFLERGLDGQTLVQNRAVFELLELRTHETARRGRPGAVFDQRNGPVLEVVVHNVMDQIFHVHEHAGIIGCGEEDQVAGAEALGDDEARMRRGHVVHLHIAHAEVGKLRGKNVRRVFGVAVDGGIGNHDCLLLGLVGCPVDVFVDKPADVLAPHGSVQRADGFNFDRHSLLEQCLYLRAVFADDVGIIPAGIVEPFGLEVHFVRVQVAVERAEGTEGVGRVECLRGHVVGDHRLGPVDHRCHDEGKGVPAGAERVHLVDNDGAGVNVEREEVPDHFQRLFVADDLHIRMAQDQILHQRAVVRLHVVDDQIVEGSAV